jgi:hypothetical protein
LACGLVIFGAHHPKRVARVEIVTPKPRERTAEAGKKSRPRPTDKDHAAQFGVECLEPDGEADIDTIHRRYKKWCTDRGSTPLPGKKIAGLLAELFDDAGISIVERGGRMIALGVSVKEPARAIVS